MTPRFRDASRPRRRLLPRAFLLRCLLLPCLLLLCLLPSACEKSRNLAMVEMERALIAAKDAAGAGDLESAGSQLGVLAALLEEPRVLHAEESPAYQALLRACGTLVAELRQEDAAAELTKKLAELAHRCDACHSHYDRPHLGDLK